MIIVCGHGKSASKSIKDISKQHWETPTLAYLLFMYVSFKDYYEQPEWWP